MIVWRISKPAFATDLLGTGAKLAGGRWNSKGVAVLYCAGTRSLCALEVFVHLDPEDAPAPLAAIGLEIPDDVFARRTVWPASALPPEWRHHPAPTSLQALGDRWVRERRTLVLELPSAIIPAEPGYLLNPAHPQIARVKASAPERFELDPRMWKAPLRR